MLNKKLFFIFILSLFVFSNVQAQFSENKVYSVGARSSGRFMNGKNASKIQFSLKKDSGKRNLWQFLEQPDGSFIIKNYGNGKVLAVAGGSNQEGTVLVIENENNQDYQRWIITDKFGFYIITNKSSGLCITVDQDYPETTNPNPDLNYAARFEQIGKGVQRSYANRLDQEFEIEPVAYHPFQTLSVPQTGWKPDDKKIAIITSPTPINDLTFKVKKEDGTVVMTGTFNLYSADINDSWNMYYYQTDELTALTTPGNYTISCGSLSADILIADDVFLNISYVHGGIVKFKELFHGFWEYNRYYPDPQTLLEATLTLDENGVERFTLTGNTYTLAPYGWYDAHSRDSKVARTAKVLYDFAMAYNITSDPENRLQLYQNIHYGIKNLLLTQNEDGSWPAGKIRDGDDLTPYDSRYYHWVINKDVNTAACAVKALIKSYPIFKAGDPALATQILETANKGWEFVEANESLVDPNIKYRGYTVDLLSAAIEMANVTGEQQYFDKANEMITNSKYHNGVFRKKSGSWPAETGNKFAEINTGTIPSLCNYYDIAPNQQIKETLKQLIYQFADYWLGQNQSPHGIPKLILDRTHNFGNIKDLPNYAYNMLAIGLTFNDEQAVQQAKNAFNLMVGLNGFSTSYIVGLGNQTPSLNFFKRSFETGIGGTLPGFTNTSENKLFQDFTAYPNTEGVAPVISTVFYLLSGFDHDLSLSQPVTGTLKINEVKSNDTHPGASFVEIYNYGDHPVDLSHVKLELYANGNANPASSIALSGTLREGGYLCITQNNNAFSSIYGYEADVQNGDLQIDGSTDGLVLLNNENVLDRFNSVPNPQTGITNGDVYIRKGYDNDGTNLTEHWFDAGENINGTPGKDNQVFWETTQTVEACNNYLWPISGLIYSETGTYYYTLPNVYHADSNFVLHLTISIDRSITGIDNVICANEMDAQYQWLDCKRNFEPIVGATERCFDPQYSGIYAVRITKGNCTATSECATSFLSVSQNRKEHFLVYPNPVTDHVQIELGKTFDRVWVELINTEGKRLMIKQFYNTSNLSLPVQTLPGLYLLKVNTSEGTSIHKIIKM